MHSPNVLVLLLLSRNRRSMTEGGGTVEIEDGTNLGRILSVARARNDWSQQEPAEHADLLNEASSAPPLGRSGNQDDIDAYLAMCRTGVSQT